MATARVPIVELRVGMYVARLDLSWFRSPFLRHSFLITHHAQIEKLRRAGVRMVEIDLDRGIASPMQQQTTTAAPQIKPVQPSPSIKSLDQLTEERAQAMMAKQQLAHAVQSVFSTITETGSVNPEQAAEAVQEITIVTRTLSHSAIFMALNQHQANDSTLSQHALTTCTLSLILGQAFQLNPLELQELATASLLHDIGLLQIQPAVIRRAHIVPTPRKADRDEFENHPRLGVHILQRQGGIDTPILHLIANHHAYLNDSGFPKESRGEFTSDRTRILMIVDRYDELLSGFGGTLPVTSQQAFQQLYQEARQGKLDQQILSTFIALVGIYPVHSHVRLNTHEIAVVTELNQAKLHQPVITITHQPEGKEYPDPLVVDLAHQAGESQNRAIERIIAMDA